MHSFVWPIRIYYEDTDAGGVVFYANYLKFYERARTELLRELGFEQDQLKTNDNVLFVVRTVQVEYIHPARFNDLVQVSAKVATLRSASILFAQEIRLDEQILSTASIRIACLDAGHFKPKVIPKKISEQFKLLKQ